MGIVVHVVDATIASDKAHFDKLSQRSPGDVTIVFGAMCNANEQVVNDIRQQVSPKQIDKLIIYGHGAPGLQGMTGKDAKGLKENSGLSNAVLADPNAAAQWKSLRPYFSPSGVVVLRGCNTAQGEQGQKLIAEFSKLLGVPVQASDWYQRVGKSDLVGNIVTANPSGKISDDKKAGMKNMRQLPFMEQVLFHAKEYFDDAAD